LCAIILSWLECFAMGYWLALSPEPKGSEYVLLTDRGKRVNVVIYDADDNREISRTGTLEVSGNPITVIIDERKK